ncbi:MAG: aminopeptidase N [Parasphingorhabdus sp.]|jgi:aminopeptidase N
MSEVNRHETIRLADYRQPDFKIPTVTLEVELHPTRTLVTSHIDVRRHTGAADLILDGDNLKLIEVRVDNQALSENQYVVTESQLTILHSPDTFRLTTITEINPEANTELNGLYRSSGNFCTQCEPEGFRRITWFIDRPDVLSSFTVTIRADKKDCPILLSNGDCIERSELDDGRHQTTWHDPWPKPSYLFALVAGDLGCLEDHFTTCSGRKVTLQIYAEHHNMDQCDHAMESLINSMLWDEKVYGREYDLDTFMIVVVDDFNMGAMENKGLNIFNSKYVLARPETATDSDFDGIESVIGHEYFHNWSGNRVTCRDWFQLSLKEGFTVFRDQEFSADMGSRGVKRIEDVNVLRAAQFPEDAGPMAHAVRPESYLEINNFYTVTIYNKGAEVVRMLHQLEGEEGFRRGCDVYFDRHDGQAVTTDDFVAAHEAANNRDFGHFKLWYKQAGTPEVSVTMDYDLESRNCTISMQQNCPDTPDQSNKNPFHIPIRTALFSNAGTPLKSRMPEHTDSVHEHVLELTESNQQFVLQDVDEQPVLSMLRGFSAPIKLDPGLTDQQLGILMAHDDDPFNRWDSGQRLALSQMVNGINAMAVNDEPVFSNEFIAAWGTLLNSDITDGAFQAYALGLPGQSIVAEASTPINPLAIARVTTELYARLAGEFATDIQRKYRQLLPTEPYQIDHQQKGTRALKNRLLFLLGAGNVEGYEELCQQQYRSADNMTDRLAAISVLSHFGANLATELLKDFYQSWQQHSLVVDKWLRLQAASPVLGNLSFIRQLQKHEAYNETNPNKVRALIGAFSHANPVQFHKIDGSGYAFLRDQVLELDKRNPQIAARLIGALQQWRRYAEPWRSNMRRELQAIDQHSDLSKDVAEIVGRCLEG